MKCTLIPGIASISGSIKQKDGRRIIFKTFRSPSARRGNKPETRMYFMDRQVRRTAPSVKELKIRNFFAQAQAWLKAMPQEKIDEYNKQWTAAKYMWRGKKYGTLRGFIFAHLLDELKKNDEKRSMLDCEKPIDDR